MAQKNKIPTNISIDQIRVEIPHCPGCEREHEISLSRPTTTKNCSRGTGTFRVTVTTNVLHRGQYAITVWFAKAGQPEQEITREVNISIAGVN